MKLLGIPYGLVINRSDIGNDDVRQYAHAEEMPILMEIPFDRKIAEAYSKGRLMVEAMPDWKGLFIELHSKIDALVKSNQKGRHS